MTTEHIGRDHYPGGIPVSLTEFTEWLAREMPPGTVISDPRWWAPRIAARLATPQQPKPAGAVFGWINPVDAQKASRSRSKREGSAIAVFVSTERTETYSMAIYTNPTPAADAGGVTEDMVLRACNAYDKKAEEIEGYASEYPAMHAALTAAITPEVRHGE